MRKFATAVAVTLLGASLALAAPQEAGNGHGNRQMMTFSERYGVTLNLTDPQKAAIDVIQKETREKHAAFFTEQRAMMKAYWDAKQANDTAKMDSLKPAMDTQRTKMKEIRAAEDVRIAKMLTADQNAQYLKIKADRAAHEAQRQQ